MRTVPLTPYENRPLDTFQVSEVLEQQIIFYEYF
jgi:hypothetical protein